MTLILFLLLYIQLFSSSSQTCDNEQIAYVQRRETAYMDIINGIQNVILQIPMQDSSNTSLTSLYSALSIVYNISESSEGMEDFTEAFDTIFDAYFTSCYGPIESRPTANDFPALVEEFLILLSNFSNILRVREIYGQLSCIGNYSSNSRKKRDDTDELLASCGEETSTAAVYNCLNSSLQQCIFSLNGICTDAETDSEKGNCVGFVIDTTGSMSNEINDAQTVITSIVQSEANVDIRCYVLVAFNDFGTTPEPYRIDYNSEYYVIYIVHHVPVV